MLESNLSAVLETRNTLLLTPVHKRTDEHKQRLRDLISAAKKLRRDMANHPDAPKQLSLF